MVRAAKSASRRPVVLPVEEEPTVLILSTRMLEADGNHVLAAANGRAALSLVTSLGTRIDLLVSDLRLPDMRGDMLVAGLAHYGHTPPVLFISGHHQPATGEFPGPFLAKPFSGATLCARVRDLLGRAPARQQEMA
jgi:DNA-binding response OmpR family regulator